MKSDGCEYKGSKGQLYGDHTKSGMYYVYQHKNPNTDEVFYIGMGRLNRCNQIKQRNAFWKNYFRKHGFAVEIIKANLSRVEAAKIEVELIRRHKPKCNLTFGGEMGTLNGIRVHAFYKDGTPFKSFPSISEANLFFSVKSNDSRISRCLKGIRRSFKNLLWSLNESDTPTFRERKIAKAKTIHQYDLNGKLVASFESPRLANLPCRTGVYGCLDSNRTYNSSFWRTFKVPQISCSQLKPAKIKSQKVICLQSGIIYDSLSKAAKDKQMTHQTLSKKLRGKLKNNTTLQVYV